jgi:PKD repeat protein
MPRLLTRLLYLFIFFLTPNLVSGQVTAGFTVDHSSGCVPLIVHFTNTSTGATSYSWDLGNGSMPTISDPYGTYVTAGTFTVTLTAYNGPATSTYSTIITVYPLPVPGFFTSTPSVCQDVPASFTNTSISSTGSPLTYLWNFGDGLTDTTTNPTHAWDHSGNYNITLYATDTAGCMATFTRDTFIHVLALPNANFSASPRFLCRPTTVNFVDSSSGAMPLSYAWSFGDGGTSTLHTPSHYYSTMGAWMDVRLIVIDAHGCTDTTIRPAYVQASSINADFTPNITDTCVNVDVEFVNTSTVHYVSLWNFGDGTGATGESAIHAYTAAGTYNVRLVIYDGSCWDTLVRPLIINPSPVVSFTVTPKDPCPSVTTFTYTATVPTGATAAWAFGNGGTATGTTATHSYNAAIFIDELTVTDTNGCITKLNKRDTLAFFPLWKSAGCAPLFTTFDSAIVATGVALDYTLTPWAEATIPYPYGITSYLWNFGDGSPTSSLSYDTNTYAIGNYTASLTVTTTNGCTKTKTYPISSITPPVTNITLPASIIHVCSGHPVTLSGTSGPATEFVWDYGDGVTEPGIGPKVHNYATPGQFQAKLMGINLSDCAIFDTITIFVDSPKAALNLAYNCSAPGTVTFGNISLGANSYIWLFGDGSTSTISPVTHTYPTLGAYSAGLATYNAASGCRDTTYSNVALSPLSATFTASSTLLCFGTPDTISTTITGVYSAYKWFVDGVYVDSVSDPAYDFHYSFNPGIHTVALALRNIRGCWDTFTRTNYIRVSNPLCAFTISPPAGCSNMPFTFTDVSTNVLPIPIASYNWNFYDGVSPFTITTPSLSYTLAGGLSGIRPVRETITDSIGCVSTSIAAINLYRPVTNFNRSVSSACIGDTVTFTNMTPDVVSSVWFFGDGSSSTTLHGLHVYSASGVYTVTLTVTDIHGCHDTLLRPGYITINPSPVASFTMSDSFAVCPPLNISFTNTSTAAVSYYWSFGNGGLSYATNPSNPYTAPGAYTITLVAFNALGCRDTATDNASVFGYTGAFTYTPISGCNPLPVHFAIALGGSANVLWDFSDGVAVSTTNDTITHAYTLPGSYVPKLILTDSSGCTAFSYGTDTIKVNDLTPWFSVNLNPVCVNTPVSFTDSSYSNFPSAKTYLWSFGGGATSTVANPVYTFTVAGVHTVTLTVTNSASCSRTVSRTVTVNALPTYTGSLAVCVGYTSTMSGLPLGGTWTGGTAGIATISSSGLVSGIANGTTQITYTSPIGCKNTPIVTVYAVPNSIAGDSVLCQSTSVTLSTTSPGGTWSSSAPSTASVGSTTGVVTGTGGGTATITYTVGSGCYITKQVTINAAIGAVSGPSSLCVGTPAGFTTSSSGGVWLSSTTAVATIDSFTGILAPLAAGTATISYKKPTGCSASMVVTVHAIPNPITGDSALCQSTSVTLTTTSPGGTWSSSAPSTASVGSTTGIVTGMAAGTARITYTLASGCYITKQVTVNAAIGAVSGPSTICVGTPGVFTTASTGGFWLSSNTSVATIDSFTGILAPLSAGTVSIIYQKTTGCSAAAIATVQPIPNPITGDSTVCQSASVTLSSTTAGGTWSSSAPSTAFIGMTTGLLTGITPGTATITYALGTGCFVKKQVTVNAAISPISGPTSVCQGTATSFTTATTGGFWLSSNTAVATIDSFTGILLPVSGGTVTVTYQQSTGCSASRLVTVIPLPGPITGTLAVCHYETTTLSDTSVGGTWVSLAPSIASIGTSGIVTGLLPGTAVIGYIMPSGCSRSVVVTVNPLPPAITGTMSICVGAVVTLHNAAPGGAWTSGTPGTVTIGLASGAMTGMAPGTGLITYILPTGCITTTVVTVLAVPPPIGGPSTVCGGHAINLTNALGGGVWSSPGAPFIATFNPVTAVVVGITPGTIAVTYTIFNGCAATAIITVNPLPPAIGGIATVCVNATTTLTNFVAAGTWTSGDGTLALIDTTTGIVTGVNNGTVDITYTISTGCYNIRQVTVYPLPANIMGTAVICEGGYSALSSATPGGTWGSYNPPVATVAPIGIGLGMVNGVSAGYATISYKLPTTGCFTTKDVTVNVTPPAITGSGHVCMGSTRTLTNAIPGGMWLSSNPGVAPVSATGVVSGVALGTAIITYILPGTSCSATRMVTVQPLPNIYGVTGGGSYCSGGAGVHVGLTGSQVGVSYALYYGASATGYLTGTNLPLDFGLMTLGGVYTVQATNPVTGCVRNMSGSATVVVNPPAVPAVSISCVPGDTVCPATMTTMSPIAVNGGPSPTYVWEVNGVTVSTAPAYSFIPADGDVVELTMTSSATCILPTTAHTEKVLHVLPLMTPAVTMSVEPGDTVCQFELVTYFANPSFGGPAPAFTWMVNSTVSGVGTVFSYVPVHGDVIKCRMLSNYLCRLADTATSGAVTMTVDSLIVPHIFITPHPGYAVDSGETVRFTTAVTDAGPSPAYQWYINGIPVLGANADSFQSNTLQHYDSVTCRVTSSGVCHDISSFDWVFISVSPVGVPQIAAATDVRLVPNPNNGTFTIKGTWGTRNEDIFVEVTNMLGQAVYKGMVNAKNGKINEQVQLLNMLANGMYILNMRTEHESKVFHFVVEQ